MNFKYSYVNELLKKWQLPIFIPNEYKYVKRNTIINSHGLLLKLVSIKSLRPWFIYMDLDVALISLHGMNYQIFIS